jgi:secreted trypsin-like serine protease
MRRFLIVSILFVLASCAPKAIDTNVKIKNSSIMNGTVVKEGAPIAASIVGVFNTYYNSICTGTLVSANVVLTAAHCVPEKASHVKIVFSNDVDYMLSSREQDILQEFVLSATDFKTSTTWDPNNETIEHNTGDIALIKFRGVIPNGYKPAKMVADDSSLKIGDIISLAGYGVDDVDASKEINPKKYKDLEEAISYGEVICEDDMNGKHLKCFKVERTGDGTLRQTEAPIKFILETEFHLNETQTGTCNGDSGGPAFIKKDGEFFLLGVTSRGSELCDEVGVYTNAVYYKKWINDTIKILK